ncbi:MAG: hypothetical protein H7317_02545 [Pseudorhodobacter sp.]|nr:hypothetical protein [Pseudorhodobacter sp.]
MLWVNWLVAWALVVGALLHGFGTVRMLKPQTGEFVWSMGSALAALLVAGLNLMLINRTGDGMLAALACLSAFAWSGVAWGFGQSIDDPRDPRVIWHMVCGLALGVLALLVWI